jgi:hypothetical protein
MLTKNYNGIAPDPRTGEQKEKDFIHEELFASAPMPVWEERAPRQLPIFNQGSSSACVAFAVAKILGIDEVYEGRAFVHLSPRDIYIRRQNQGQGGMYLPDALNIARLHGATTEELMPSEGRNEAQQNASDGLDANSDKVALRYKSAGFVELPRDIDAIAGITTKGKGVLLGHRFDYSEWTTFPKADPNSQKSCGHGTAAHDNILIDGKKHIVMDDSWGPNQAKFGQRFLSEEWLKLRSFYAGYTINFIYDTNVEKPHYFFTKYMKRGDRTSEVVKLQDCLKYLGMFPTNVESTGLYGPVTQRGVLNFQKLNGIPDNKGVQAGPKTIAKLNELFK